MATLSRLRITKFRNVAPGTELTFSPSLNVMLGRNGTGKTTLLTLISSILGSDFTDMAKEEFAIEYDLHMPLGNLTAVIKNERREIAKRLHDQVPMSPTDSERAAMLVDASSSLEEYCEIRVHLNDAAQCIFRSAPTGLSLEMQGVPQIKQPARSVLGHNTLFNITFPLLTAPLSDELSNKFVTLLFASAFPTMRRFDEALGYFDQIGLAVLRIQQNENAYFYLPWSMLPQKIGGLIASSLQDKPDEDTFKCGHGNVAFLARFIELAGFKSAEMKLDRLQKNIDEATHKQNFLFGGLRFDLVRGDNSAIDASLLSFGQKRLLAFLIYLEANGSFVVADELVNGLHHEWIESCLGQLAPRQAFLTSQNPLLLDYLSFTSADHVRSSFITCRREPRGIRERLLWSNMSQRDAHSFFSAYEVGIQHVSEILKSKALW